MTGRTGFRDFYGLGGRRVEILRRDRLCDVGRPVRGLPRELDGILGAAALLPESFNEPERVLHCPGIVGSRLSVFGGDVPLHALVLLVDGSHPCIEVVRALSDRLNGHKYGIGSGERGVP